MPLDPDTTTLAEAWDAIEPHLEREGIRCPLCGGFTKVYYQPLTREMALFAATLARWDRRNPGEPAATSYLLEHFRFSAGVYGRVRAWGIAEPGPAPATWLITDIGRAWVHGQIRLLRYVRFFMNKPLGPPGSYTQAGKLVAPMSLLDALGNYPFDLATFMAGEG